MIGRIFLSTTFEATDSPKISNVDRKGEEGKLMAGEPSNFSIKPRQAEIL